MAVKNNYFNLITIVLILCTIALSTKGEYFSNTINAKLPILKKTTLHFYVHDIYSGKSPSIVLAARPNITLSKGNRFVFGSVYSINDLITAGPELNSTVIGNAQGLFMSPSKNATAFIVMYLDFGFTSGKFNGSSLSIFSRNPIYEGNGREIAIVGGRGRFKLAKGYSKSNTYSFNTTTGDAVIDHHITVYHYY